MSRLFAGQDVVPVPPFAIETGVIRETVEEVEVVETEIPVPARTVVEEPLPPPLPHVVVAKRPDVLAISTQGFPVDPRDETEKELDEILVLMLYGEMFV